MHRSIKREVKRVIGTRVRQGGNYACVSESVGECQALLSFRWVTAKPLCHFWFGVVNFYFLPNILRFAAASFGSQPQLSLTS